MPRNDSSSSPKRKLASTPCVLHIAQERRLSVYPDAFCPEHDICDVTLWLQGKYRVSSFHLWIDRHYTQIGREIAGVTVMISPQHPEPLSLAAREAFLSLGYRIEDSGADIYALPFCNGRHSHHEALQAHARIEAALRTWRAGG